MTTRPATLADAPALARLTAELGYTAEPADLTYRLGSLLPDPAHSVVIAEDAGVIVGWIQTHLSVALESGLRTEIVGLVVAASARRRGVGRALVQCAETWSAARGATVVVVRSNLVRTESHLFYPSLGYTAAKTQAVYRKTLSPPAPR